MMPRRNIAVAVAAFALALGAAVLPAAVQAQLEPLPWEALGPDGGAVTALAVHPRQPDVLYAGTRAGGVFVSLDGGRSWTSRSFGLRDYHVLSLAVDARDAETVYVGTSRDGLWRGTSFGQTWQGLHGGFPAPLRGVQAVAVDPAQPRRVYMSYGGELFRSLGGIEWSRVGTGLPASVAALVIDPRQPRTLYAGTATRGVFKSTDYGTTWTRVSRGLPEHPVRSLTVAPSSPRTLYASLLAPRGPQVFRTDDAGATWRAASTGLPANAFVGSLAVDPAAPRTVYAATLLGLYKSSDGGQRWRAADQGLGSLGVGALAIHPASPALVWAGTGIDETRAGGVYRSTNGGVSWTPSRRGMTATYVFSLTVGPALGVSAPAPIYAATGLPGSLWASRNGGRRWTPANQGLPAEPLDLAASRVDPVRVYAGTTRGVFRSDDGGATWSRKSRGIAPDAQNRLYVFAVGVHSTDPDVLYAATEGRIYTTTDRGETWRPTATVPNTRIESIATSPAAPDVVYAAGRLFSGGGENPGQLYRSEDAGQTWQALDFRGELAVAADPADAETVLLAARRRGLFRSLDGGRSFARVDLSYLSLPPRTDIVAVAFAPSSLGTAYAVGRERDGRALVLRSQDGGVTWESLDLRAMPQYAEILDLEVDEAGDVYLATRGNGVFRLRAGEL